MSDVGDDIRAAQAELGGRHPLGKPVETPSVPVPSSSGTGNQSPEPSGTTGTGAARARDEAGRFAKGGDKPAETAIPVPPNEAKSEGNAPEGEKPAPPAQKRPPPQSFRPSVRGDWEKVPESIQEEIHRVEGTTKQLIQQSAGARKVAEQWEKTIAPYKPYIQGEPSQYVDGLLRTAAQLQTASAPQVVAQIIRDFRVDIKALDEALSQEPAQAPRQPAAQEEYRDPRVDQILQHLQHMQWAPQVQAFEKEAKYLDEPMPQEFGNVTVRDVASSFISAAGQRGVAMTLQQAYDAAIALHPTLREAQRQTADAKQQAERNAQTAAARAASSSVRSEPVVVAPEETGGGSARDDVRASWRMLQKRG